MVVPFLLGTSAAMTSVAATPIAPPRHPPERRSRRACRQARSGSTMRPASTGAVALTPIAVCTRAAVASMDRPRRTGSARCERFSFVPIRATPARWLTTPRQDVPRGRFAFRRAATRAASAELRHPNIHEHARRPRGRGRRGNGIQPTPRTRRRRDNNVRLNRRRPASTAGGTRRGQAARIAVLGSDALRFYYVIRICTSSTR